MSTREFPMAGPGAGINAEIEINRAKEIVFRNSRFLLAVTLIGSVAALFMSLCMVLVAVSLVFPLKDLASGNGWAALRWVIAALAMGLMCPWLWKLGRAMAFYQARMDRSGVNFRMGTKQEPQELFMAWDQIAAIQRKRMGNNQIYTVSDTNGSEATFTSYTFFRPKKLARLIAARTGQSIQKA